MAASTVGREVSGGSDGQPPSGPVAVEPPVPESAPPVLESGPPSDDVPPVVDVPPEEVPPVLLVPPLEVPPVFTEPPAPASGFPLCSSELEHADR